MKFNVKCSKSTILKAAGIALTILGGMVDNAERKIEIREAVEEFYKSEQRNMIHQM